MTEVQPAQLMAVGGGGFASDAMACVRMIGSKSPVDIANCAQAVATAYAVVSALPAPRQSTNADMNARCMDNADCFATMSGNDGTSSGSGNPNSVGYYDDDMQDF